MNRYQRPNVPQAGSNQYGDTQRAQSLSNGAGQAALAALRMHSPALNQQSQQPSSPVNRNTQAAARRANSLTTAQRTNSLRTYTYNPKPSYIPGQANINNNPSKRVSSAGHYKSPASPKSARARNSLTSRTPAYSQPSEHNDEEHHGEESIIITTKTTKIVDSQGRTQSITTETIKSLPDGSNIIEKTTKNISRGNSRSNSLRNNSILSGNNGYNLSKIEEDLQDFDYSYQVDGPHGIGHSEPKLKLNTVENSLGSPIQEEFSSLPNYSGNNDRAGSLLSENNIKRVTSSDSSPSKPLKSILKNRLATNIPQIALDDETQSNQEFKDAADTFVEPEDSAAITHPYKKFTSTEAAYLPPKSKVPSIPSPPSQSNVKSNIIKQLGSPVASHPARNDDLGSFKSATSPPGSIKFSPEVETIPIYSNSKLGSPGQTKYKQLESEEKLKLSNQELYAKALLVAQERVYGNKTQSPASPVKAAVPVVESPISEVEPQRRTFSLVSNMSSLVENKTKRDKKLDDYNKAGVEDRYRYENHHRDFAVHSFRSGDENPKPSSRKERAKEEKRLLKQQKLEAEKAKEVEKQLKKEEEKQRKEEEKLRKEEAKKAKRLSSGTGLFGRRKSKDHGVSAPLEATAVTAAGAVVGAGAIAGSTVAAATNEIGSAIPQAAQAGTFSGPVHVFKRPAEPQEVYTAPANNVPTSSQGPVEPQEVNTAPPSNPVPISSQVPAEQREVYTTPARTIPISSPSPAKSQEVYNAPTSNPVPTSSQAPAEPQEVYAAPASTVATSSHVPAAVVSKEALLDNTPAETEKVKDVVKPRTPPNPVHEFEPPHKSGNVPGSPATSNYKEPIEKPVLNQIAPDADSEVRSGEFITDEDTDIDDTEEIKPERGLPKEHIASALATEPPQVNTEATDLSSTITPVPHDNDGVPDRIHPGFGQDELARAATPPLSAIPADFPVDAIEIGPIDSSVSKYHEPTAKLPTIIAGLDGSPIVLDSADKSSSFDHTIVSNEERSAKESEYVNKKLALSNKQDELDVLQHSQKAEVDDVLSPPVVKETYPLPRLPDHSVDSYSQERIAEEHTPVKTIQEPHPYAIKYDDLAPDVGAVANGKTPSDATASSADEPPEVLDNSPELEKKPTILSKISGKKYNKFKQKLFKYFVNTYEK